MAAPLPIPNLPGTVKLSTGGARAADDAVTEPGADGSLPYQAFDRRHPCYNADYWRRIRALYRGGEALLQDHEVLKSLFIRNGHESEEQYIWRCAIAMYLNYCSEITDFIVAGLGVDPIRLETDGKPVSDEFVVKFCADSTPPGGDVQNLHTLVTDVVLEALQTQTCWVELCKPDPVVDPEAPHTFVSQKEAEAQGADKVWAYVLKAEQVINWQETDDGDLEWAVVHRKVEIQEAFWKPPIVRESWTRWTRDTVTKWEIRYPKSTPPTPNQMVPVVEPERQHTSGRVPLIRYKVKPGLWVMDKLESIARAHFNKLNTLDVYERRALMPQLYEFLGSETANARMPTAAPSGLAGRDPDRATRTPRGPQFVQERGSQDKAMFVGPDPGPVTAAWNSLDRLRDEMHRIVYQMSLAAQQDSGAALARSGESRRLDRASVMTILQALGKGVRDFVINLVQTARAMRGDAGELDLQASGVQKFDAEEIDALVAQTEILSGIQPPSPTAMVEIMMRVLRRTLDHLDEETFGTIKEELEGAYTPENLALMAPVDPLELEKAKAELGAEAPEEEDTFGDPGTDPDADRKRDADELPPAKPKAKKPVGKAKPKAAKPAPKE